MQHELPKQYDHSEVESKWYEYWQKEGLFHAKPNPDKKPFTICIPPPNITGKLHMGHALDNSLQDVMIRYHRMAGYETLWLPGTDHASIATEVKIVEQLRKEGIDKRELGREGFLKRAWQWRAEYGSTIVSQLKKLGSSCDWERERFTMDEGCSRAVTRVFKQLYDKGLIYRGDRIINWCPCCKTALSDAEVEYESQDSHLWHVRYDAPDKSYSITVATTRPETMLGDTGIAVNPKDERYIDIIGKTVVLPLMNREIPIVADEYCEMDFGTGAVKITPGHDPNDFEVGLRTGLPCIRVFTDDGHINENGGAYEGLDRMECRKRIVEDLKQSGNLVKTEAYTHNVGTCYRCHTTIETMVSKQWFVDMKPLVGRANKAVEDGEIKFVPERFSKAYFNWMYNIRDWCISRQLWWGHRIPVYYCDTCGGTYCEEHAPACCPDCGAPLRQDEDVLDTWFSSGLWPFSTLGWPDNTEELKYFYPTSTICPGYDIITFWISRMIVFGYEVMDQKPFDTVYIHGIVRDALGRKMSKSLGNGIDPLEIIEKYGADPLRFSLITGNAAGNDMRFNIEKVDAARNFCNKVYNASRFLLMNLDEDAPTGYDPEKLDLADRWILSRLDSVIREVTQKLEDYDLNIAAQKVYDFIWGEFCDWYIEIAKFSLYGEDKERRRTVEAVLIKVLGDSMKLLHPFMPFITEELYSKLPGISGSIMVAEWPTASNADYASDCEKMECVMELVRSIRNLRADMKVPPAQRIAVNAVSPNADELSSAKGYIVRLAGADKVEITKERISLDKNDVHLVCSGIEAFIPLSSLVDMDKERERVDKEITRINGEIARAEGKLSNERFVQKAPEKVVEEERAKLSAAKTMLEKLLARRSDLG